ncbi:MAG: hypothetical protein HYS87_00880 [Candidatus Colwellbacteria bacterium]|nr:hypothetical protein [Candidatus Colwellbacteria bacterium]
MTKQAVTVVIAAALSLSGCVGGNDEFSGSENGSENVVAAVTSVSATANADSTTKDNETSTKTIEVGPWDAKMQTYVAGCLVVECFSTSSVFGQTANPSLELPLGNITQANFTMTWSAVSPTTERFGLSIWAKSINATDGSTDWRLISDWPKGRSPLALIGPVQPIGRNETSWLWVIPLPTIQVIQGPVYINAFVIPEQQLRVEGTVVIAKPN